jgi:hypothetical protein
MSKISAIINVCSTHKRCLESIYERKAVEIEWEWDWAEKGGNAGKIGFLISG